MAVADDICASRSEQLSSNAGRRAAWMRVLAGVLAIGTMSLFSACSGGSPKCPKDDGDPCTLDECKAGVAVNSYLGDGHPCFVGKLQGACKEGRCAVPCEKTSQCNDGLPCTRGECQGGRVRDWRRRLPDGTGGWERVHGGALPRREGCVVAEAGWKLVPGGRVRVGRLRVV